MRCSVVEMTVVPCYGKAFCLPSVTHIARMPGHNQPLKLIKYLYFSYLSLISNHEHLNAARQSCPHLLFVGVEEYISILVFAYK